MFKEFSNGYYFGSYWITNNKNSGKINNTEYERIKLDIYPNNIPILMKIGNVHFEVKGDENVPTNTIQLSSDIISQSNADRIPEEYPVLLAKPQFAKQLIKLNKDPIKNGAKYLE